MPFQWDTGCAVTSVTSPSGSSHYAVFRGKRPTSTRDQQGSHEPRGRRGVPPRRERRPSSTERVVTDRVRLRKHVHDDQEVLDIPVQTESLEVERVPVDRWIDTPAAIRQEGDTTIYPVVEEIVVEREAASRDADRDPEA
jgi:stress response protein YsnF